MKTNGIQVCLENKETTIMLARSSNTTNEMSSVDVTSSNQEEPNWVRSACCGSNHEEQQKFKQLSYVNQEKTELCRMILKTQIILLPTSCKEKQ
jgi:hypothetical protein